ncbi:MAG: hypothetical protein FJW35_10520, partial [Acidobacteria bacterium]|nr:hypothetical protein [Acidobacteriota bacterium]
MKESTSDRRSEAGKPAALISAVLLIVFCEGMKPQSAAWLSAAHLGWMVLSGAFIARAASWQPAGHWTDRGLFCYVLGWISLPLFIAVSYAAGNHALSVLLTTAALGVIAWRRTPAPREPLSLDIPLTAYLIALAFLAVSIVLPFSGFNEQNIARELFT